MTKDEAEQGSWTVGEISVLTRVSVRTLHHYDQIGLLSPSERSETNYRLYSSSDLVRLHSILTFKELGFSLAEIGNLLTANEQQQLEALHLQKALLKEKQQRLQDKLEAIEHFMNAQQSERGMIMNSQEIKQVFDRFDPAEYETEVKEHWGNTDAYQQSAKRTQKYSKADWEQIKAEMDELNAKYIALMEAGVPADDAKAAALAELHRQHIHKWFYDCNLQMLQGVSEMWVNDKRFAENIDKAKLGLAAYQYAVVQAWAKAK